MSADCGKTAYPNPASAWRVILHFTKPYAWLKHKEIERPIRAYQCHRCHQWHLSHLPLPHKPRPVTPDWPHATRSVHA